jgi:hypothetical protein
VSKGDGSVVEVDWNVFADATVGRQSTAHHSISLVVLRIKNDQKFLPHL